MRILTFIQENLLLLLLGCAVLGYLCRFIGKQIKGRDVFDVLGDFFSGLSGVFSKFFGKKK